MPFFPQLMDIVYWETSDPPENLQRFSNIDLEHTSHPQPTFHLAAVWGSAIYRCSRSILSGSLRVGSICSHLAKDTSFCLLHQHEPKRMPGLLQWRKTRISKELEPEMGNTLPKTNIIAPENGWLVYYIVSFWDGLFSGASC